MMSFPDPNPQVFTRRLTTWLRWPIFFSPSVSCAILPGTTSFTATGWKTIEGRLLLPEHASSRS